MDNSSPNLDKISHQLMSLERPKKPKMLVVDDEPDILELIEYNLKKEGYQVTTAKNGQEAVAEAKRTLPDLIILDIMMPKMDGYEVTRRIRQNKNLPFIPILLITAYEDANVPQGLDLGANDFIRKPIEYDELMARIKASLRLKDMMNSPQ